MSTELILTLIWTMGIPISIYYSIKSFKRSFRSLGIKWGFGDYLFVIIGCIIGSWAALLSTLINPLLKSK